MTLILGLIVVFGCTFGGYIIMGGKMSIIIKAAPFELLIILGSGIGALIIGNPGKVSKKAIGAFGKVAKGPTKKKDDYMELLCLLYQIFKMVKSKGVLAIEGHVENPKDSDLFKAFPKIQKDHHVMEFLCDYLRLWTLGTENPAEMSKLLDEEIDTHHHEVSHMYHAYHNLAEGLPALGIVAAVLGVIKTMAAITEPPEVLGKMIGGALVGTFLGVFLSYGMVGPMAQTLHTIADAETKFYQCIKAGLLAHMAGYAPAISIEFARKTLTHDVRPTFLELEEKVGNLPPV